MPTAENSVTSKIYTIQPLSASFLYRYQAVVWSPILMAFVWPLFPLDFHVKAVGSASTPRFALTLSPRLECCQSCCRFVSPADFLSICVACFSEVVLAWLEYGCERKTCCDVD